MRESSSWEIYRFELVFFDARFKRWQYFEENPLTLELQHGQAPHRRQIQQILDAVRSSFGEHVESTDFETVRAWQQDRRVRLMAHPMLHGLGSHWSRMLNFVAARAQADGLVSQHRDEIVALMRDRDFLKYNDPEWANRTKSEKTLSGPAALDLISLLPVASGWELPGCWYNAWREAQTEHQRFPPAKLSPALWREPSSLTRLTYKPSTSHNTIGALRGFDIQMEARARDLSDPGMDHLQIAPGDYFAEGRCREPKAEDELAAYLLYSYFTHNIFQQLCTRDSHDIQSGAFIVISYPVLVPGWTHFLHIYVRARLGHPDDLERLCVSWHPLEARTLRGDLRAFLSEAVQRLTISLFQKELADSLVQENKRITDDDLYLGVAKHACMLFPLQSVTVDSDRVYAYRSSEGWHQWQECAPATITAGARSQAMVAGSSAANGVRVLKQLNVVPDTIRGRSSRNATNEGRIVQLFEQQIAYAHTIREAFEHQQLMREKQLNEKIRRIQVRIEELNWAELEPLRLKLEHAEPETSLPVFGQTLQEIANECLERSRNPKADVKQAKEMLQRFSSPPFPLVVSEYLAIGPVKRMCHNDPRYFTGPPEVAVTEEQRLFQRISARLKPEDLYTNTLTAFHTSARKKLQEMRGAIRLVPELSSRRNKECSFHVIWAEDEALTTRPPIPKLQGISLLPGAVVALEVHWPVDEALSNGLVKFDQSLSRFGFRITGRFSFALKTPVTYSGALYGGSPPVLYRNFLILRYHLDPPLTKSEFEEQSPPDAFSAFCTEFTEVGRFYLAAKWAGVSDDRKNHPIDAYRYQLATNTRLQPTAVLDEFPLEAVFPSETIAGYRHVMENVFGETIAGDYALIFAFDSWRS
ncbi:MAG TPA: hypothetical protein VMF91_04100 [Bryobacteraceae bacterium]|nr:hypothetical protein [Bryobacteraceae bacterium]